MKTMKNPTVSAKWPWFVLLALVAALALSACRSTDEHPSKSEHPTQEHPQKAQPAK